VMGESVPEGGGSFGEGTRPLRPDAWTESTSRQRSVNQTPRQRSVAVPVRPIISLY